MSQRTTLFLILVAVFGVLFVKWQGAYFFTDSVRAEKSDSETTLIAPSGNTATESKKDTETDIRTDTKTDTETNVPSEDTAKKKEKTSPKQTITITPPTFTASTASSGTESKKDSKKDTEKDTKPGTAYVAPASGSLQVTTTAQDAERVEYYSQGKKSDTETYLGAGKNTAFGEWSLNIDAANPENRISQVEKAKFENSKADTDGDGVSDKEEIRLGANPEAADTDKDGFLDGDEIKNGFDPLKFSVGDKSDKIVFESPQKVVANAVDEPEKKVSDKRFRVDTVDLVDTGNAGKKATRFSGKALPNMFITLYIYSDPIIVTVKTDAEGNWTYDLDKELPDGDHEIFVAVTDNVGKISAQSEALPFVKTAQAVAIKPAAAAAAEALQNASPLDRSRTEFIIMAIVIALSFLGIALVVIGRKASVI